VPPDDKEILLLLVAANVGGGVIPDCGHWVAEEQPDFVLNQLKSFLSQ
jgi:pimeloyl-ACP methyl ester carboxylesterase